MTDTRFKDFGQLYKAAFAEREPERKLLLLNQVRRALEDWETLQRNSSKPPSSTPQVLRLSHTA